MHLNSLIVACNTSVRLPVLKLTLHVCNKALVKQSTARLCDHLKQYFIFKMNLLVCKYFFPPPMTQSIAIVCYT